MRIRMKDGVIIELSVQDIINMLAVTEASGDVEDVHYNNITKEFTVTSVLGNYRRVVAEVVDNEPQPMSTEETKHYKTLDALEEGIRYMRILEE